LYPILHQFEKDGWLSSRWEQSDTRGLGRPARKLYRITAAGRRVAMNLGDDPLRTLLNDA
jgi:DNA-binding PadR family transcriptional regulator